MTFNDEKAERVAKLLEKLAKVTNGVLIEDLADVEHEMLFYLVQADYAVCIQVKRKNFARLTARGRDLNEQVLQDRTGQVLRPLSEGRNRRD